MMHRKLIDFILIFTVLFKNIFIGATSEQFCFFPPEIHGEYRIQNAVLNSDSIQYSTISITNDYILPYGQCYSRNGTNNVIVTLSTEDDRIACYRCFNLQLVSKNILLLIHTESDINSKCSSSAETAKAKCPSEVSLNDEKKFTNDFYSIILYKVKETEGPRRHEFCPFDGEIKFDYYLNDQKICSGYKSTISNCPSTSSMNIHFKDCTKGLKSIKYDCIGNWNIFNQNFLAVIETSTSNETETKYKCGTYEYENEDKTEITLRINNDCSLLKRNKFMPNGNNQQIYKMRKTMSFLRENENDSIKFPSHLQGDWTFMKVERNTLTYHDVSSFRTYFMTLTMALENNRYIVHSKSQCGEEAYKCIVIDQLDENVIETQISSKSSKAFTNYEICNNKFFDDNEWFTQGRIGENVTKVNCPVSGIYHGRLPDDIELCSKILTNCENPDIMTYQIGPCNSPHDIYETRTYRCLGHWVDKKSTNVYTLTKRVDVVNSYECFAGLMANTEEGKIYIREAGEGGNCYKEILDVKSFGMEMNRTGKCPYDNLSTKGEEIIVKPTQKDSSTKYEVFDESNEIEIGTSTVRATTKKPKKQPNDANSIENETSSISSASASTISQKQTHLINLSGLILMIRNLQSLIIIVKSIL